MICSYKGFLRLYQALCKVFDKYYCENYRDMWVKFQIFSDINEEYNVQIFVFKMQRKQPK